MQSPRVSCTPNLTYFMSFKRLLPTNLAPCVWLALGAFSLPACFPLPPTASSTHTWPAHGNQYYNYWDGKYLGCDSTGPLSWRLIDSAAFEDIRQTYNNSLDGSIVVRTLLDASRPITIDSTRIQTDLQWVKDSSVITGREYQVYLFLDRATAIISSLHGEPGTNHNSHPYIESDRNHGVVSPIPADSPMSSNRILIGQVHGHPAIPGHITLRRMSPDDSLTAVALQAPIYAIDAMDGTQGAAANIHRANPDPGSDVKSQDLCIGRTWGISGFDADSLLNIGLNALRIWGISRQPNFDFLRKIDSTNNPPSLASRQNRPHYSTASW
jgi:hypothetical protein